MQNVYEKNTLITCYTLVTSKDSRTKKRSKKKKQHIKGGNVMKVIAVSHGSYSKGLVDSVQMLVGEQENLVAYGLFPEQTVATLTEQLEREVNDTPEGEEILFLTDLFHGSPFKCSCFINERS